MSKLTGSEIVGAMRKFKCTIRDFNGATGITLRRIREVRRVGLADALTAVDWLQSISGIRPVGVDFRSAGSCWFWVRSVLFSL